MDLNYSCLYNRKRFDVQWSRKWQGIKSNFYSLNTDRLIFFSRYFIASLNTAFAYSATASRLQANLRIFILFLHFFSFILLFIAMNDSDHFPLFAKQQDRKWREKKEKRNHYRNFYLKCYAVDTWLYFVGCIGLNLIFRSINRNNRMPQISPINKRIAMNAYWKMCTIAKMFYTMEWYEMRRKKEVNDRRSKFKMVNMVRILHMSLSLVTHSFFFFLSIKR